MSIGINLKQQSIEKGSLENIRNIHIVNVEMKKELIAALVAVFRNRRATCSSTVVIFDNANLCGEGIEHLSKMVDTSLELQSFCLINNWINIMQSARCLSMSLKSHACIARLYLAHCDLGSSPAILMDILQSDVDYINLEHNNIDSLGAVKIAEYLEGDPPIKVLSLGHNRLNDDDAILISLALKRNTNLKTLSLYTNNITSIGVKALITCVFDSSSLNAISESNHTLTNNYLFSPFQASDMKSCITSLLEMNRVQKIVLALQDKDSLLQYLANIPKLLFP